MTHVVSRPEQGMDGRAIFQAEDPVLVDASEYELESPGKSSKLPGIIMAVTQGPQPCYDVRVRLRLGTMIDLRVPSDKVCSARG